MRKQIHHHKTVNEKLTLEFAQLKRFKFAKRFQQISLDQTSLLDDPIDTDIATIETELKCCNPRLFRPSLSKILNAIDPNSTTAIC